MADQPKGQSCGTCRYYFEREPDVELVPYDNPAITGFCRRYPIQIIELRERMGSVPGTIANHWCGEYARENPETVTDAAVTLARLTLLGDLTAARALADLLRE